MTMAAARDVAREQLARLQAFGYDDVVLVTRRHDDAHPRELRALR